MAKNLWNESFDSFLGCYIDPERVEELREIKAEIDVKVKAVLKSLYVENDNCSSKGIAMCLIEDLNDHYQSLYSRYDHLIKKLSEDSRGENCSSSDSSDPDFSMRKSGKKTVTEQITLAENVVPKSEVNKLTEEITRLEENTEELRAELEMKADEISRLSDVMRIAEVSQRLTSRKLRVTEQVLGEKEENLLEARKLLEEKNAAHKESQMKTERVVSEKVTELLTGIDNLSVKFEEGYDHLESCVCEIVNELKFVVNWIAVTNSEKDRLKNELADLLQQLKEQKELETTLQREEDENKSRILSLCEEKREAIRQLCISIDYHRSSRIRLRQT